MEIVIECHWFRKPKDIWCSSFKIKTKKINKSLDAFDYFELKNSFFTRDCGPLNKAIKPFRKLESSWQNEIHFHDSEGNSKTILAKCVKCSQYLEIALTKVEIFDFGLKGWIILNKHSCEII